MPGAALNKATRPATCYRSSRLISLLDALWKQAIPFPGSGAPASTPIRPTQAQTSVHALQAEMTAHASHQVLSSYLGQRPLLRHALPGEPNHWSASGSCGHVVRMVGLHLSCSVYVFLRHLMELRSIGQSTQLVRRQARQRRQLKRLSGAVLPEVWYALSRKKSPSTRSSSSEIPDLLENFLSLSGSGMLHRTQVYSLLVANMIFRGWAFAPFLSLENPGRARHPLRWNDCIRAYATDQGCIFRGMQHAH